MDEQDVTGSGPGPSDDLLLDVRGLTKRFGGLTAVSGLDMSVKRQSVTAVIGPNGAGKSTLFNLITGAHKPSEGDVFFNGDRVTGMRPDEIAARGIARTFQNVQLFEHLNAMENVLVARRLHGRSATESLRTFGRAPRRKAIAASIELLERVGIASSANRHPGELPYGDQRRLEIARALALEPELLILDEPTAGMVAAEYEAIIELIRDLRDDGISVMLVEHNMNVVMSVSDWVVAVSFGKKIAEGTPESVRTDDAVIEAYLGAS